MTPLKPLEAMAMEKVVMGSDVEGIRELVKDGETALLLEAGNVQDLVKKALMLLDDGLERKRLGRNARKEIVEERDWAKIVRGYLPVYEKVCHPNEG